MTLKNNRAPLLSNIKLCASFHRHMWIQTGVTVRKRLSGVMTSLTLTFNLWPWHFAWTSHLSLVITPEKFRMIRWWEHSEKGVTDGQTDRQTDGRTEKTIHRAAWSEQKNIQVIILLLVLSNYRMWFLLAVKIVIHYSDVIMSSMASRITGVSVVYSTVCLGADQRKRQGSAPLAFMVGINRWQVNSPQRAVTRKIFPLGDVIMVREDCWC